jgi:hypothetical protein
MPGGVCSGGGYAGLLRTIALSEHPIHAGFRMLRGRVIGEEWA